MRASSQKLCAARVRRKATGFSGAFPRARAFPDELKKAEGAKLLFRAKRVHHLLPRVSPSAMTAGRLSPSRGAGWRITDNNIGPCASPLFSWRLDRIGVQLRWPISKVGLHVRFGYRANVLAEPRHILPQNADVFVPTRLMVCEHVMLHNMCEDLTV